MATYSKAISITFMSGPLDGKMLKFQQPKSGGELVLQIGRQEDCEINLDFDSQVSRLHACLGCKGVALTPNDPQSDATLLSFWLEDSGSRNGTLLNNEIVTERVSLQPGTLFRVGRTWLRLDVPLSFDALLDLDESSEHDRPNKASDSTGDGNE